MDEIIVRPKYSRQTGTQRRKRREPDNELMSTVFAAKLLVAVIILSVLALCKAADTPATKMLISKVKVITTSSFDTNKYLISAATAMGIKLPKAASQSPQTAGQELDTATDDNVSQVTIPAENSGAGTGITDQTKTGSTYAESSSSGEVQVLYDQEIKAIADKVSMVVPIKGNISSGFGTRTDPLSGTGQFHTGIDIEANMGTSIKAVLGGEVIEAGTNAEYGKHIKIKHADGLVTVYAHCSLLIAKTGQKVNQGDAIAKVGDSEGLNGALHFEVWKGDKAVDPEKLLNYINH